ncbi:MAG: phosphoglucosamine mutase [Acidobacteria bacterium]|nr:phosphoglucosamine mutase [Acidobacteriota bacterium]
MGRQLFGTDGIRGVAGNYPLDPKTVNAFGQALGHWAARHSGNPAVLLGMDTRESGPWLAQQVASGLAKAGVAARFAGLITTPGVAYLTRTQDFAAGVMISASHNPFEDNGLKVFGHDGYKIPDSEELSLEGDLLAIAARDFTPEPLALTENPGLDQAYVEFLASCCTADLRNLSLVVDCAHGAASHLGPSLLTRLGADVQAVGCEPNGRNINLHVGATHVDNLRREVLSRGTDLGVAFDGDADRAMFVAGSGKVVDGDAVMLVAARELKRQGHLAGDTVVATVMSNLGLEVALRNAGIRMLRAPVGDKYVLEQMMSAGAILGGEQSGHVIFHELSTTGDGLLTALQVLSVVQSTGKSLDELTADLQVFPQKLVNVRVKEKRPLSEMPGASAEIAAAESAFNGSGRVLVRFSGTEPLIRVMVEGRDQVQVDHWVNRIAHVIQEELA